MSIPAQPSPAPVHDDSIDTTLAYCIIRAETNGILLDEVLARLGPASFCFVALILAVPFIQPIPLGPYTMASGITFMAVGWQMMRGHISPALPKAMRSHPIHGKGWLIALRFCQRIVRFCRKFTCVRLPGWVGGSAGTRRVGVLIFTGGFLLAIPFANLPFNNTLPALMILFAAIAWLERDGLMILISLFWGAATLLYFAVVGTLVWFFGKEIAAWFASFFQ